MLVITMASRKGGVGKSSSARSLAVQALIDGMRTAIIDADPQGTVLAWAKRREAKAPAVYGLDGTTLDERLVSLRAAKADLVVIDTPPSVHPIIGMAAQASDLVLVVTGPYPDDLSAIGSTVQIAKGQGRGGGIILNRTPSKSTALQLARGALAVFDLPICPTAIVQRVAHPYSSSEGMTAQEWEPGGTAAKEIEEVWRWTRGLLGIEAARPAEAMDAAL
jgi:chromosome partitioning protein